MIRPAYKFTAAHNLKKYVENKIQHLITQKVEEVKVLSKFIPKDLSKKDRENLRDFLNLRIIKLNQDLDYRILWKSIDDHFYTQKYNENSKDYNLKIEFPLSNEVVKNKYNNLERA